MIVSDRDIKRHIESGKIKIEPCDLDKQLSTIGIDLRLGNTFRLFKTTHKTHIELSKQNMEEDTELVEIADGGEFILHPDEFVLGITKEHVEIPNDLAARIDGKSSLGRLGIIVHSTAGHVDPGYKGKLTLEITNIGRLPVKIVPGMKFCFLMFEQLTSTVDKAYSGKYLGTNIPQASKINEDFNKVE